MDLLTIEVMHPIIHTIITTRMMHSVIRIRVIHTMITIIGIHTIIFGPPMSLEWKVNTII